MAEWSRRKNIRKSLREWCLHCGYQPAAHHEYIIAKAELAIQHKIPRLMVMVPPGSAKSTYLSVLTPPYFLAQHPNAALLAASHSVDLSESFGRKARNLIDANPIELGYKLASHSKAAGRWETSRGGSYYAAGVGTSIAGYRADLVIIDDPIGKREDADSKLVRDNQWDWWNFDVKTRMKPGCVVIFIYTPWNEDDLGHRILATEGDQWHVVRIPFFAEDADPLGRTKGTMLWPEWFKQDMYPADPRVASALYQLRPTPEQGDFFLKAWLTEYKAAERPEHLRMYCASDHAFSLKTGSDKTLLVAFGVDSKDNIWIMPDFIWDRIDTAKCVEAMLDMAEKHKPLAWFTGKEHIVGSMGPFLNKRMTERGVYFTLDASTAKRDKQVRAQAIRGRMAMQKVLFPGWLREWPSIQHELLSFPAGAHDEWPDVLGEIGRGMEKMSMASVPTQEPVIGDQPFRPTFSWLKEMDRKNRHAEEARYGDR